jgi:hypothetical protein
MKRFLPRLLGIACVAACLTAPDTFAKDTSKSSSARQSKFTHGQGGKRHAKSHIAKSAKAKHGAKKAAGQRHARPA